MYDTDKAKVVATNRYWDGGSYDPYGRGKTLMKSPKGSFFVYYETRWQSEVNTIEAVSIEQAKDIYEELPVQEMPYKEAFGVEPEDA